MANSNTKTTATIWTAAVTLGVAYVAYRLAGGVNSRRSFLPVDPNDAIVVTGAHTGIGKHAALTLAKEGYTVFCGVRQLEEHGQQLVQEAQKNQIDTSKIKPILLDVTKEDQVLAAVETVRQFMGDRGLYGLFNNAGIGYYGAVEDTTMEDYRRIFEVNYFGLLQVTKAFLPLLRQRRGRIISNTSIAGKMAGTFFSAYASSKFAVEGFSDALRREVAPFGVSVSLLEPGLIKTPIFEHSKKDFLYEEKKSIYSATAHVTGRKFMKLALDGASPRVTSQAVVHAMRAPKPKLRYMVGYMAGLYTIFLRLPDEWVDALMAADTKSEKGLISDEEVERLIEQSKDEEFEF